MVDVCASTALFSGETSDGGVEMTGAAKMALFGFAIRFGGAFKTWRRGGA